MAFRGWPAEAIEFYEGLEADNTKAYWTAHRDTYERSVKAPMDELLAELATEFGEGTVFRPYRDVRFSADKSPYKTSIAASIGGRAYVQLSASGLGAGCGTYALGDDELAAYRRAVDDEASGSELAQLVDDARLAGMEIAGHGVLKTAPRGYPRDHPRVELLRLKGLHTWQEWPPGPWLGTAQAEERVVELLRASAPISAWLDAHVRA